MYIVGGGDYGYNLSNKLDSNSYVVDTGEELWLIDAGFDGGDRVLANIKADWETICRSGSRSELLPQSERGTRTRLA
jgi:hypothetical protein